KLEGELKREFGNRVALLTGTLRGFERDALVETNAVYRALLTPNASVDATVYLASTSAGEVGIDLDADHMICDLITLDSMIQRLGRVNRRGGDERIARVDVLADLTEKPSEVTKAMRKTMALARLARRIDKSEEGIDVSPLNIRQLLAAAKPDWIEEAFSPKPDAPPLTDVLLDAWSLTSIDNMPGRPEVRS